MSKEKGVSKWGVTPEEYFEAWELLHKEMPDLSRACIHDLLVRALVEHYGEEDE